jgi:endo-1,4-beta-D-glucanase Y
MNKKNKKQTSPSKDEKVTNENPVSLSPVGFKEALAALLKVKPKTKEQKAEEKKEEKTSN